MPLVEPREKCAADDLYVTWRESTDKLFRGPHTTTLLIFRLTPVIMAVHNRLCKRIFTIFADWDFDGKRTGNTRAGRPGSWGFTVHRLPGVGWESSAMSY